MRSCPLRNIFTSYCPNTQRQSRPWAQQAWARSFRKRSRYFRDCFSFGFPVGTRALCSGLGSPPFAPAPTSLYLSVSPQPEEKNVFIFIFILKNVFQEIDKPVLFCPCLCSSARQCVSFSTPPAAHGTSVLAEPAKQKSCQNSVFVCALQIQLGQKVKTWYLSVLAVTTSTNPS